MQIEPAGNEKGWGRGEISDLSPLPPRLVADVAGVLTSRFPVTEGFGGGGRHSGCLGRGRGGTGQEQGWGGQCQTRAGGFLGSLELLRSGKEPSLVSTLFSSSLLQLLPVCINQNNAGRRIISVTLEQASVQRSPPSPVLPTGSQPSLAPPGSARETGA